MANSELIQATIASLRGRRTATQLMWVKGHDGHERNEGADEQANEGANKATPDVVDLQIPAELRLSGAKLSAITQSLAYKAVRERKLRLEFHARHRTEININRAKEELKRAMGRTPTEARIWKAVRHKDFTRQARYFLWMTAHDAYMVGSNWLRPSFSPEMQERAGCVHCGGELESMEHILTQCETYGQNQVWRLAEKLWVKRNLAQEWPTIGLGLILASALMEYKTADETPTRRTGDERFFRILVSESAHLIWKLRCERIIQKDNVPFTKNEVRKRWVAAMNRRLEMDRLMTNPKYEHKALSADRVTQTWSGVLLDEDGLPDDGWLNISGVLVGITAAGDRVGCG